MPEPVRVVHYLNQFFGGLGGEAQADARPQVRKEAVGPGLALQRELGEGFRIVGTLVCGDSYFATNPEEASATVAEMLRGLGPNLVIAGPSFGSGRYGLACAEVCRLAQEHLGVPAAAGMHLESPAADLHRRRLYIISTTSTAGGMAVAVKRMAALGRKLVRGEPIGSPEEEGYLPQALRVNRLVEKTGAERVVDMLLKKMRGEPFETEQPAPLVAAAEPAPPARKLAEAVVALVTEGGIVPQGNPDGIPSFHASKWGKYPIAGLDALGSESHECIHGGFDVGPCNEDPNRMVPLDVVRQLERDGRFGRLHEYFYSTCGNLGAVADMRRVGQAIADDLKASGVQAVILTAT